MARLELVPWSMASRTPSFSSRMRCSPNHTEVILFHRFHAWRPPEDQGMSMLATVLSALAVVTSSTAPDLSVLHQYQAVALNASGNQVASIETVRKPNATTEEHGAVVVRGTDGEVHAR